MAQLIGLARLGRDAELRSTQDGTPVASLSLAMDYRAGREKATQWVDGALWGKMAETLAQYLVKGKLVCVTLDDVHIEEFQRRDGGSGTKLVGRVSKLELAGGGRDDGGVDTRDRLGRSTQSVGGSISGTAAAQRPGQKHRGRHVGDRPALADIGDPAQIPTYNPAQRTRRQRRLICAPKSKRDTGEAETGRHRNENWNGWSCRPRTQTRRRFTADCGSTRVMARNPV